MDIVYFDEDILIHLTPIIANDWVNGRELVKMLMDKSRDVHSLQRYLLLPLLLLDEGNESSEDDDGGCLVVKVCDLLMTSLYDAVTSNRGASEEETAMKRETGALGKLQDFREVMETLARRAVVALTTEGEEEGGEAMLRAFARVYEIAPFALESQLETLLGDEDAVVILGRLKKKDDDSQDDDSAADAAMEEEEEASNEELSPLYASLTSPLSISPGPNSSQHSNPSTTNFPPPTPNDGTNASPPSPTLNASSPPPPTLSPPTMIPAPSF